MPDLSIILPCYNEADNVPLIFQRFREVLAGRDRIEVLMVDNGSTDHSKDVFQEEMKRPEYSFAKLVQVPTNQGYGFGIMSGVREAAGEVIAWTHADFQTDPKDVLTAYETFSAQPDLSKVFLKGRRVDRNLVDAFFTFGMSAVSSLVLKERLFDVNAQPKMFHRTFLDHMKRPPDDFSLDLYVLYLARKLGLEMLEQPVSFAERKHGEAKGGGTMKGKMKLVARTWTYIIQLKREIREGLR